MASAASNILLQQADSKSPYFLTSYPDNEAEGDSVRVIHTSPDDDPRTWKVALW